MSKSKQPSNTVTQALRRRGQSLSKKTLDIDHRFIDDLMGPLVALRARSQTKSLLRDARRFIEAIMIISRNHYRELLVGSVLGSILLAWIIPGLAQTNGN